jgi:hypothetical protein
MKGKKYIEMVVVFRKHEEIPKTFKPGSIYPAAALPNKMRLYQSPTQPRSFITFPGG